MRKTEIPMQVVLSKLREISSLHMIRFILVQRTLFISFQRHAPMI